jgi:hypothetical protein
MELAEQGNAKVMQSKVTVSQLQQLEQQCEFERKDNQILQTSLARSEETVASYADQIKSESKEKAAAKVR